MDKKKNLIEVPKDIKELPGKFFPGENMLPGVPAVDDLKLLGLENLIKIQGLLEDIISRTEEGLEFWKKYQDNTLVALSLADPRPMIPDLRTSKWVTPGDKVLLNFSDYNPGETKERTFGLGTVCQVTNSDNMAEEISISCEVNPEQWQVEKVSYVLHSPCIIKVEDLEFFKNEPGYARIWLELVGCIFMEYKLDDGTKAAIMRQIELFQLDSLMD